jgi:AcrR family transcriptional regulator
MTARKKGKAAEAGEQRAAFQTTNNSGNDTRFEQQRGTFRVTARTRMSRMSRRARHDEIMAAALRIACDVGYTHVTREDIALAAGCSPALVSEFFGTLVSLRRSIQRAAVANHVLPVIAQGLALRDPHALRAPAELRAVAAAGALVGVL